MIQPCQSWNFYFFYRTKTFFPLFSSLIFKKWKQRKGQCANLHSNNFLGCSKFSNYGRTLSLSLSLSLILIPKLQNLKQFFLKKIVPRVQYAFKMIYMNKIMPRGLTLSDRKSTWKHWYMNFVKEKFSR